MQLFEKRKLSNERSCLTENVLYYAKISCDNEKNKLKLPKEFCPTTFNKCYKIRKKSVTAEKNKNDTKLSTEYWKLGNKKPHPRIS